ncbi:MAG TPA: hypothetical protein VLM89_13435 [Phycisphaerae bacterium]|nr:hypothetical protein [Phycisphaerae bacterium]
MNASVTLSGQLLFITLAMCPAAARGQSNEREPRVGYLYPAGGQQGTTFQILAGGRFLGGATDAYISGKGVRATVIEHFRPLKNLDKEQREELQKRFRQARENRLAEQSTEKRGPPPPDKGTARKRTGNTDTSPTDAVALPSHPLLRNLDHLSLRELEHVRHELFNFRKQQPAMQIAESVLIEITIDRGATPGDRELRLRTPLGLTSPMRFQVGALPEVRELEPNDPPIFTLLPPDPPHAPPVLINGQIKPGDVDRFRFRAKRGQHLVIEAHARRLIPYLADAVPGWFQPVLTLRDSKGNEVAFADDYRFDPDPVLLYQVPGDGEYELEIHDSIYRGRDDFVYRIAVGEQPFITRSFPLGGRMGTRAVASVDGWNLSSTQLPLRTPPGTSGIHQATLRRKEGTSNQVAYAVDMLPECEETEPNDTRQNARRIDLPRIVNGRIAAAGDVDVFQFEGRVGDAVVAEVYARRLNSPMDSLLRLTDVSGRVLEWNDDHEDKEAGLLTHHADSYLHARLPADGVYYVHLADAQNHGGDAYGYRLRVGAPRPDFALRLTPSSLNVRAGGSSPVCVYALRKDGFNGDIEVVLKDSSAGFKLSGGRIPAGRDRMHMTLMAPSKRFDQPVAIQLEGCARVGGYTIRRPVVPADDLMQAFIYRHLVPAQQLMVATTGIRRPAPPIEPAASGSVRLSVGGTAEVRFRTPRFPMLDELRFELREPPEGVTLQKVSVVSEGLALVVKADDKAAKVGSADNLVVEAFTEMAQGKQGQNAKKTRVSLGVLPAIPLEIVNR